MDGDIIKLSKQIKKWLSENTSSLSGKTVAITGSTGGIGKELCRYLAYLGAALVLVDRSAERSMKNAEELRSEFSGLSVECVLADLCDVESVKLATEALKEKSVDYFIHNAGAYSIPRCKTKEGYDNVFTINFISPYYIIRELMPAIKARGGKAVVVGSIAHNYSKTDPSDVDFSNRKAASKVYGNAKRFLTYSLLEYYKDCQMMPVTVTHPGITFTNITAHYPKLIFAIIKYPMKVIFMKPKIAALSVLLGLFGKTGNSEWIGPSLFDIWGMPKVKRLNTAKPTERSFINEKAEEIYESIKENAQGV